MKQDNFKDFTYKSLAGVALEIAAFGGGIELLNYFYSNSMLDEFGVVVGSLGVAALGVGVGFGYVKTVLANSYARLINEELAK